MNHQFYVIWAHPDGNSWDGPFMTIAAAKGSVPEGATAELVTVPLAGHTPAEKRAGLPILERTADSHE